MRWRDDSGQWHQAALAGKAALWDGMGGRMGLVDWVPQGNCMFS
jgi:hypothetical protein